MALRGVREGSEGGASRRGRPRSIAALLVLAGAPHVAAGSGPPRPLDLFDLAAPTFTVFTAANGVPEAVVYGIAVDRAGFVWLASPIGLARYDGRRWEAARMPVPGTFATTLFRDPGGTVWATPSNGGLARYDGDAWGLEGPGEGLPPGHIQRVVAVPGSDGRPRTWALAASGELLIREGRRWRVEVGPDRPYAPPVNAVTRTREIGGEERLWVGTVSDGLWYRDQRGSWHRETRFGVEQIDDLLVTRDRGREELWVATLGYGLGRLTRDGATSWLASRGELDSDLLYDMQATVRPDGARVLWVSGRGGLVRVLGDEARVFDRRHGLPSNAVRGLHLWRSPSGEDVLWIATENGVARTALGSSSWQVASTLGSTGNGVFGVRVEPDGRGGERLWITTSLDGLALFEDGRWRTFGRESAGLPGDSSRLVARVPDENGRDALLVGSESHLMRVVESAEGPRFVEVPTPWVKKPGEAPLACFARRSGGRYERWVGTRLTGLHGWREGRWTTVRPAGVIGQWRVNAFAEQTAADGEAWVWASSNRGLLRYDGTEWELLGRAAGLPEVTLLSLTRMTEPDGRTVLWAGSDDGVLRFDVSDPRRPRALPSDLPPPPHPVVYGALRDSRGRVWVATNSGVQQLVPDGAGGYRQRVFTRRDGMVHDECNLNGQFVDAHDRYWVGTLAGLAVFDPDVPPDRQPKPFLLKRVRLDGEEVPAGDVVVPAGTREIEVDLALLSWHREGESRFRTQLLGFDPAPGAWTAQSSRVFGGLPPGPYRLRAEAHDYGGTPSAPLEIALEVKPRLWQRTWFRASTALVFLVAWPVAYLGRVRQLSRQKAALERGVARRTAELAAANERLALLSRVDPLTGVANRRRLDEVLDEEWRRAARLKASLAFLLLDVDHFKAYNDHLGHQAGDVCLKAIADALAALHARAGELVARYGGEEFAVVMPATTLDQALAAAERIRLRILELGRPHPGSSVAPVVTVSVGAAALVPCETSDAAELVHAADQALYAAKSGGRNLARG